jgi:phosphohistidine phosphatase
MKTLLLMRHAKSSWKDHDLEDIDRPLTKRGRHDAPEMGSLLKKEKLVPQLILSSNARRAFKTAGWVAEALKLEEETIQIHESLYLAETEDLIKEINLVPNNVDTVLIIGHNPGLEALAQLFTEKVISMPTASIAYLKLPVDQWADVTNETEAELKELFRPAKKDKKDKKDKK